MPKKNGFTLVELMVVITIIGILSVIGIAIYSGLQKSARDTKRKQDIMAISKALEARNFNDSYPAIQANWFVKPGEQGEPKLLKDSMDPDDTGCNGQPCKYCFRAEIGLCTGEDPVTNTEGRTYTVCANLESGIHYCISNQQ